MASAGHTHMTPDATLAVPDLVQLCTDGAALTERGDHAGAVAMYEQALSAAPQMLDLSLLLANAQQLAGDELAARTTLRQAVRFAIRPTIDAEFTLGKALVDAGAGADAVACFRRVRTALPNDAVAIAALAASLRDAGDPETAWTEILQALGRDEGDPLTLLTAARIRHDLGDFDGAQEWCERALTLDPALSRAQVTRGYLRHLRGDAVGGWQDFESRPLPDPGTTAQRWHGEPLDGRTLLVMGEQGVGDQLQFVRFTRHRALNDAGRIVVSVNEELVSLLRACGVDAVARGTEPRTQLFVPLLSLPHVLRLGDDRCNAGGRYLAPSVADSSAARPVTRRVGLVWAGNPAHRNDRTRSFAGSLLGTLVRNHPGVTFVSLQRGAAAQTPPVGLSETATEGDWLETAAQLATLDLLITVDTGIAHLAGAMGRPVWLLLPQVPDWRWGPSGISTAWYPSARLFRQQARGDWAGVLTRVSAALSMWHADRR